MWLRTGNVCSSFGGADRLELFGSAFLRREKADTNLMSLMTRARAIGAGTLLVVGGLIIIPTVAEAYDTTVRF